VARAGRLAVYSGRQQDGKIILPRFLVLPDDGSEPIELRVNRASVSGKSGEAVMAVVRCYVTEIDIHDGATDTRVSASARTASGGAPGAVIYPHVNVTTDEEPTNDVRSFLWRMRAGSFGRIVLERITLGRKGRAA
jgi:hypothetical protein